LPANSGAIAGTIAHDHSSSSSEGGFLQNNLTGFSTTANGSMLIFDGSSIAQNLPAGNLADVLTMGAAVPAWTAPSGGGAIYEKVGAQVVANNQQTMTITPAAPISFDTVSKFQIVFSGQTGGNELQLTINSLAANYFYTGTYVNNATRVISAMGNAPAGDPDFDIDDSNFQPYIFSTIDITADPVNDIIMSQITTTSRTYFGTWGGYINSPAPQTALSTISMYSAVGNFLNGSTLDLYKINIV